MASDEDYAAFLDKANQDPGQGTVRKEEKGGKAVLRTTEKGVAVPSVLSEVAGEHFYVSDADEPFEAVALRCEGNSLPDEVTFAKLVQHPQPHEAEISILDIGEWDPRGEYKAVVDATRTATKGSDVRVYRVQGEGARVEYFLVGLEGGKILGVKALAVES